MASSSSALSFTFPNVSPFMTYKLSGPNNYLPWTSQLVPTLNTYDLMGIVDGTEPCPPKTLPPSSYKEEPSLNPAYSLWFRKDQFILSWINATLSESVLSTTYGLRTSYQIWQFLATKFASQSRSRIAQLRRELQTLHQGSQSCADFLNSAKLLAHQLSTARKKVEDEELITYVIGGLNPTYNHFVTSFTFATRDSTLSFDTFQADLLSFDYLIDRQQQRISPDASVALLSTKPTFSNFPKKSPHKAPFRHNNFQKRSPHKFSQQPRTSAQQSFTAPRSPCQICGKSNHHALDCFSMMDYSFQGRHPPAQLAAMAAQTTAQPDDSPWFADNGANHHLTPALEKLQLTEPYTGSDSIAVGNGSGLQITHTGSASFHTPFAKLQLSQVFHCPNALANLLSINQFCKENNCFFILTDASYFIKDCLMGLTLLEGKSEGGLYPIRTSKAVHHKSQILTALLGVKAPVSVWHSRLGHPSSPVVRQILKKHQLPFVGSLQNKEVCESCQLAKSKQLPFSLSSRVSSAPLQLVHTDVWCSPVVSFSGFRYYVIFIDDFSRYSWLYPLHIKSDVFISFKKFKALVENQFSSRIKTLQSDGGGEFTSLQFTSFLETHGIFHRISCPYTSQQNGLAERKHRHVVEMGLSLIAQSGLPQNYWVESFLTAIFLINRLPTPLLNQCSPYYMLFKQQPDYSILKSFGCLCFPLLRPYVSHKLMFRSKRCIFLGYGSSYKGYRCLDPLTNKVFITRHVVFDEKIFPAKVEAPSALSAPASSTSAPIFIPDTIQPNSLSTYNDMSGTVSLPSSLSPSHISTSPVSVPIEPSSISPSSASDGISPSPSVDSCDISVPLVSSDSSISDTSSSLPHSSHGMVTRSRTGTLRPKTFPDYKTFYSTRHPLKALSSVVISVEPSCYSQAVISPEWRAAMGLEFDALLANGTWSLCPRPVNHNVVRNKWVYKIKRKQDGSLERFKARLVAKGFD